MSDTFIRSLYTGEELWRLQPTHKKASLLKPYFDADGYLTKGKQRKRNVAIAKEFQIHASSVALQRKRYLELKAALKKESSEERDAAKEARLARRVEFLIDLHIWARYKNSEQKGVTWWRQLNPGEKWAAIKPLIALGMSNSEIAHHLELGTKNRVVGLRDRQTYPKRIRGVSTLGPRILKPKRVMWSLDATVKGDSKTTWHEMSGAEDPAFAKAETNQLLQALLNKRKLANDVADLLKRLMLGDDLDDEEYALLGSAIREHADLLKIVEHL